MSEVLRLFIVEDDDDIALLITKTLQRAGHEITRCRTAADALIVLGHNTFDLVLLDQRLPDMAGLELLDALAGEGIATPSLMVTAYGDEQLATRVLQAGALDYVVKDPALAFLNELPKRVLESVTRHRLQHMNLLLIESLESARDGIMITDLQGTILHVNQALERMTGYTRAELCGHNPRLLRDDRNPPELYADLWRTIVLRGSWQGELTNRRKDGSLSEISLTVSPIVGPQGQLTHFVGIQRDISDRKFLERQLVQAQKMQSVGTLAGGVAHEFNNLLAGISGYASLGLREPALTEPLREFLQHIVNLSERAASLTRQLLAFARKPALDRRPIRMDELVKSTAELVRRTLHAQVIVECDPPAGNPGLYVDGDHNQLQQTFVNLALNARDAQVEPTPIVLRVGRKIMKDGRPAFPENVPSGDYVAVEVIDRGSGMTPEVLNQALDPFFSTKPVGQGTGLGLPVVFGIVRGHQGYLAVESEPGKGTTIGVYLPHLADPGRVKKPEGFEAGEVVEPEGGAGRKVLVLDDEPAVRDVIRRFLEIAGHEVRCAASAAELNDIIEDNWPADLVILDMRLPAEDCTATIRKLRAARPELPLLLCTGLLVGEPPEEAISGGRMKVIRKPFRMNELWYAVNEVLGANGEPG